MTGLRDLPEPFAGGPERQQGAVALLGSRRSDVDGSQFEEWRALEACQDHALASFAEEVDGEGPARRQRKVAAYLPRLGSIAVVDKEDHADACGNGRDQRTPGFDSRWGPFEHRLKAWRESHPHTSLAARLTGAVERPVGALPPLARRRGVVQFAGTQR